MYRDIANAINRLKEPLLSSTSRAPLPTNVEKAILVRLEELRSLLATPLLEGRALSAHLSRIETMFVDFVNTDAQAQQKAIRAALAEVERIEALIADSASLLDNHPTTQKNNAATPAPRTTKNGYLDDPVQFLKGVGPRLAATLAKKRINTIGDLLYFLPRQYEDRRKIYRVANAPIGARTTISAPVLSSGFVLRARKRVFEALLGDHRQQLRISWFHGNFGHLAKTLLQGTHLLVSGEVRIFGGIKTMIHPDFEIISEDDEASSPNFHRIIPIYPETDGLNSKTLRKIMRNALETHAHLLADDIPAPLLSRYRFPSLAESVSSAHFPPNSADCDALNVAQSEYHRRIIYDEFFFLQLGVALKRREQAIEQGVSFTRANDLLDRFLRLLPFKPTSAQLRVINEILVDMQRPVAMNRLLQGDVGSGKTLVALVAMLNACANGYQAILMAPTELLATQHHRNIANWLKPFGFSVSLLVGSLTPTQKRSAMEQMQGEGGIIIGTHALLYDKISLPRLGLVVIDEQHRFGVDQRAAIREKGTNPDILVMTATPIPRTLAMSIYGDLEVSVIDQLPAHKKPIKTKLYFEAQRLKVYDIIREEINKGNQAFIVYPLVEETDAPGLRDSKRMAEHLQRDIFGEFVVGLVHGRMKTAERDAVMSAFQQGQINILVATTVVEVGIDIPEASLMVIENAERFGLSQLHQLRGRVGRGEAQSFCLLLAQHANSQEARRRLKIMEETSDGFIIAEEDLAIRGPGEFLGTKQSGIPDFRVANIIRDADILANARHDAFALVAKGNDELASPIYRQLFAELEKRWAGRLKLSQI
ncbi:MAG: ATP-dependent DNA helicase RecG [Deltaproteobacteria bacterium]|nr:ATP-dependent DNA helicase RecG [Deltaproteobacteria bacterium]